MFVLSEHPLPVCSLLNEKTGYGAVRRLNAKHETLNDVKTYSWLAL